MPASHAWAASVKVLIAVAAWPLRFIYIYIRILYIFHYIAVAGMLECIWYPRSFFCVGWTIWTLVSGTSCLMFSVERPMSRRFGCSDQLEHCLVCHVDRTARQQLPQIQSGRDAAIALQPTTSCRESSWISSAMLDLRGFPET